MVSKRRVFITCLLCLVFVNPADSQLRYSVVGTYKGKSAQGMAIWEDNAYLFNDGGHCRVLNLESGIVQREFDLSSAKNSTHVNAACFGNGFYESSQIPVIYITEYNFPYRCFVECIGDSLNMLVQTIQARKFGKPQFVQSWIVDAKHNFLYAIARVPGSKENKDSDKVLISKYRLPLLSEGDVVYLDEDKCLDSFYVRFASGTQGGSIRGKYMYLPTGLQESARGRYNAERVLQVIDLERKILVKRIDLTYVSTNEPEDIDFYKDKALLYCGQEGGIYEIDVKSFLYERNDNQ